MNSPWERVAALACLLSWLLAPVADAADPEPIRAGMRLRDALRALEEHGLRIFYSNGVVRHRMRVDEDPRATEAVDVLAEILLPAGLGIEAGPGGSWVVVRTADVSTPPAVPLPPAPLGPSPTPTGPKLNEVIVAASRYEIVRDLAGSRTTLEQDDLEHTPSLGDDTIRVASRLPGMATNGVSSRSNIRGGEVGEMLVRFDGLRLYDPFHLKDFQSVFSTLDPRVVSSMDVYTGGFPAAFGNRMSGVMDVETMSPPKDRYHEIGMSFFNSSILSAGRFADSNGEWVASARRSNLDLLYDTFSDLPDRPTYLDTFGKVAYEPSRKLRVAGYFFFASDDLWLSEDIDREERAHADHEDLYYWIRLDHRPNERVSGVTLVSHGRLESLREGASDKDGISHGALRDRRSFSIDTLQSDWSRTISDTLAVQFGGTVDHMDGHYDYVDEVEFDMLFDVAGAWTEPTRARALTSSPQGHQLGAYASVRFNPIERLTADFGLRWDRQEFGTLDSDTLSPRIGLRFAIAERTDLRASIGRYSQAQYINELQISDGELDYAKPQRADHLVLGITHEFVRGTTLRVEAYEKRMADLRPRYENLLNSLILLPELKPDRIGIAPEQAKARGLEVLLERRGTEGPSWSVGYSYARVEDVLAGVDVLRSWDQTHAVNAGASFTPGPWDVSIALIYRTGWPISSVALDSSGTLPMARLVGRNEDRVDFYRSFDVRAMRTYELERSELTLSFELINAFDRKNACCTEYEIGDEDEAGELLLKTLDYLPRVPSVGFIWKF